MPRIPKRYREKALDLLRVEKPYPILIGGEEIESLAGMLYAMKAFTKPRKTLTGFVVITYEATSDGAAELGVEVTFADGRGKEIIPSAEFARRMFDTARDEAIKALPDEEDNHA